MALNQHFAGVVFLLFFRISSLAWRHLSSSLRYALRAPRKQDGSTAAAVLAYQKSPGNDPGCCGTTVRYSTDCFERIEMKISGYEDIEQFLKDDVRGWYERDNCEL